MAKQTDQNENRARQLSGKYLAWLSATIFFLSVGLFLFIQELADTGSDLFSPIGFSFLVGLIIACPLIAAVGLYKSLAGNDITNRYRWVEGSLLLCGVTVTLGLELLSRIGLGLSRLLPLQNPTDLTLPILILAVVCTFISKRYKDID